MLQVAPGIARVGGKRVPEREGGRMDIFRRVMGRAWWGAGERELEQPPLKSVPRATSCARWSRGIIRYATATARLLRALLNLVMNAH